MLLWLSLKSLCTAISVQELLKAITDRHSIVQGWVGEHMCSDLETNDFLCNEYDVFMLLQCHFILHVCLQP